MKKFKEWTGPVALLLVVAALAVGVAENTYPGKAGYSLVGPATGVFEPTQHDTNQLTYVARAVTAEADGTIKYECVDGTSITQAVVKGQSVVAQIVQIYDTGTTLADSEMTCSR